MKMTFKQKSALRYIIRNGEVEPRTPADGMVMRKLAQRGILVESSGKFDLAPDVAARLQTIIDEKLITGK